MFGMEKGRYSYLVQKIKNRWRREKYTLSFFGERIFLGINDILFYIQNEADSDDDAREKNSSTKLEFIKYVARMLNRL